MPDLKFLLSLEGMLKFTYKAIGFQVFFRSAVGREPIDTSHVPHRRWVSVCSICKSTGGACVDCTEIACQSTFHVSCALKKDLAMEYRNGRGGAIVISFCEAHTARWNQVLYFSALEEKLANVATHYLL